jgi:hypothetical protein
LVEWGGEKRSKVKTSKTKNDRKGNFKIVRISFFFKTFLVHNITVFQGSVFVTARYFHFFQSYTKLYRFIMSE